MIGIRYWDWIAELDFFVWSVPVILWALSVMTMCGLTGARRALKSTSE